MGTGYIAWNSVLAFVHAFEAKLLVNFVKVAAQRFRQHTNHWASVPVNFLRVLHILELSEEILAFGSFLPGLLEITGAGQEWVLDSL